MIPAQNTVPYRAIPWVTWCVIVVCVLSFVYQFTLGNSAIAALFSEYALVPARYTSSEWAKAHGVSRYDLSPFLTSMFLHGGVLHILFNLWTLWVFGPALEDRMGPARYAVLYVGAGLAAGITHLVFNFSSAVPTIGASGAIAGVIGAYARRFPYAWVNVLQPIVFLPVFFLMPALLFAVLWFLSQVAQATGGLFMPSQGGGVAWWAHIGGFVAGWLTMGRIARERDPVDEITTATRSTLWPLETWTRWMTWWWRR